MIMTLLNNVICSKRTYVRFVLIWKVRLSLKRQSHLRAGRKALETGVNDYRLSREPKPLYPLRGDKGFYPRGAGCLHAGRPAAKRPEDIDSTLKSIILSKTLAVSGLPRFNERITPRKFLQEGRGVKHKHPPLKGRDDCTYQIYPLREYLDYASRIKSMEWSAYTLLEHVERNPGSKTRSSVKAIKMLSYCYDAVRGYLVTRSAGGPKNLLKLSTPVFRFLHTPLHG